MGFDFTMLMFGLKKAEYQLMQQLQSVAVS